MNLTGDGLVLAFSAASGVVAAILTSRHTRRTDAARAQIDEGALELDERRVDGAAYERAQVINQQIVASLERQVERLEQTIEGLRGDLAELRERNGEMVERNTELAGHIRELEDSAATMRRLLKDAGIEYPSNTPPAEGITG